MQTQTRRVRLHLVGILRVGMCAVEPIYVSAHVNCINLINAVEYYKNALIALGNQS